MSVCGMCVCVCLCARVSVCACVCACVRACACRPQVKRHAAHAPNSCQRFCETAASYHVSTLASLPYCSLRRRSAAAYMAGVIENCRTHNPLTLWTVPLFVHVWVWVHILGDPQSVQPEEHYKNSNPALNPHYHYDGVWLVFTSCGKEANTCLKWKYLFP